MTSSQPQVFEHHPPEETGSSWKHLRQEEDLELHPTDLQGHKRPLPSQEVLRRLGRTQDICWLLGPGAFFQTVNVAV